MAEVVREIEQKFDVAPDFAMPDLRRYAAHVETDTVRISSVYHDTAGLDLLRYRLTLRRRGGGADTGWQLKVPGPGERTELRWPTSDEPPDELIALLRPFVRDGPLAAAVTLGVTRRRHHLRDARGILLAEVALDDVRATSLGVPARAQRWHEAEVELGPAGSRPLLVGLGDTLVAAGAVPSTSRSKLARAVLGVGNENVGAPRSSAGAVLIDYLARQCDALVGGHFAIARDADDAVHRTRVASRRMRSTLRTFDRCFDADQAAAFETELRWYAEVLGGVRDAEVLRARLRDAIDDLPAGLVAEPVAWRIDEHLSAELDRHRTELLATMDGDRYARLLREIVRWRDDPPFTAAAGRPAKSLRQALTRAERTLARRLATATGPDSSDEQVHRARKAGKRLRYAAETVRTTGDPHAERIVEVITKLQEILGEFQDSVVAGALLQRLAAEDVDDGFSYGVLVADQHHRRERARERLR